MKLFTPVASTGISPLKYLSLLFIALLFLLLSIPAFPQDTEPYIVSGTVLMPDGSPAVGTVIECNQMRSFNFFTATTDSNGKYKIKLPTASYFVKAKKDSLISEFKDLVEVNPQGVVHGPMNLKLHEGCRIKGMVSDTSIGKPVSGGLVINGANDYATVSSNGEWSMIVDKGQNFITFVKDGYSRPVSHYDTGTGDALTLDLKTKPAGTIKGRVTDDKGNPVAGARIGSEMSYFWFGSTATGSNGEYTLDKLDTDVPTSISVSADGYEWIRGKSVIFPAGQKEVVLDFILTKTKTRNITGRVTDAKGNPVDKSTVAYGLGTNNVGYKIVTTKKDGTYKLEGVSTDKSLLVAHAPGFAPTIVSITVDTDANIDFTLQTGHTVAGRVEDEDGNPIEGVGLSVGVETQIPDELNRPYLYDTIAYTSTDKEGRFKLENLPADGIRVDLYAKDYDSIREEALKADKLDYILILRKPKKGIITGKVIRASDGQPVPEFKVRLEFSRAGGSSSGLSIERADGTSMNSSDGIFTLSDLVLGEGYSVSVEAPGYMRSSIDPVMVKSESESKADDLIFRLAPSFASEGIVTDSVTGEPVSGVNVAVLESGSEMASFIFSDNSRDFHPVIAQTDENGHFKFEKMLFSFGSVGLIKPGYGRTVLYDIDLSKPINAKVSKACTITGMTIDDKGEPLAGAGISLYETGDNREYRHISSGPDGKFTFTDLAPGKYCVIQSSEQGEIRVKNLIQEIMLTPGQQYQVDWDKKGDVIVEGTVTSEGKPISDARVGVNSFDTGLNLKASVTTGKSGKFNFSIMDPGVYRVSISVGEFGSPGYYSIRNDITFTKGINRINLEIPNCTVSGTVIDSGTGKPLPDVYVGTYLMMTNLKRYGREIWQDTHTEPHWRRQRRVKADSKGHFEIKNMEDGEWMLVVENADNNKPLFTGEPFKLAKNQRINDIIIKATTSTGSAEINIIDAGTGLPVSGILPVCSNKLGIPNQPDMTKITKISDVKPPFMFPSLAPGKYAIYSSMLNTSFSSDLGSLEVKPGQKSVITVKVDTGSKIVFEPEDDSRSALQGNVSIGYKILSSIGKKPVLKDYKGYYWGGILSLSGPSSYTQSIYMKPGIYYLEAVLVTNPDSPIDFENGRWKWKGTVKVLKGKDTVIKISLK
ncbi:MAG: carboxypeptidase regulatory-like domain-containing protein [Armatimonadota bacterium]